MVTGDTSNYATHWKHSSHSLSRILRQSLWFKYVGIFVIFNLLKRVSGNHPPQFITGAQTEIVVRLKEGPDSPIGGTSENKWVKTFWTFPIQNETQKCGTSISGSFLRLLSRTLVYQLRGFDVDGDTLTFGIKEQLGSDVIRIENSSNSEANMYLNKELDREIRDEYLIILTLSDGHLGDGNFITQSFLLLVDDINDNEPVFKSFASPISVQENSAPDILTMVEATDADEGPYGQVVYYLQEFDEETDNIFSISTVNGKGVIRLIGKLDYERSSLHQLKVLAVDRANDETRKTGTAAILIKVQDVEDQPPEFVMVTPVTRISEDVSVGSTVLQVKAIDGDRGINNKISYSITSGAQDVFGIDSYSGVISTLKTLDRESPATNNGAYILQITAKEESSNLFPNPSVRTEITIIITDVNDEVPTFRSARYVGEINENAQTNTPVTFIGSSIAQVFDYDQGNNGTFEMFIEGDGGIFDVTPRKSVNEASFLIRVKDSTKLDYEQIKIINFTLIAKEAVSTNAKFSSAPFTIYVRDINDNFPEFTQTCYEVTVPENSVSGTIIAYVEAEDSDSNLYGSRGIRYTSLGGSLEDKLDLDPLTGQITIKSPHPIFDREQLSRHYLTVEVRDDLGHGNRNTAQLIINVSDVNDNAPTFTYKKYDFRLQENKLNFEGPSVVEAYDLDLNGTKNSEIRYSIVNSVYWAKNFSIDPIQGLLKPKDMIDFEKLPTRSSHAKLNGNTRIINLMIEAKDLGVPSLSSEIPITIYVEDINDHAPRFEQTFYHVHVPEDLSPGSSVLQVKAWDEDGSSPNNVVVYRIQSGAEDKFVVDATTGIIRVAQGAVLDPDLVKPKLKLYSLHLIALDGGIGEDQQRSSAIVNITIQDVNNKAPVFMEPGTIHLKENTPVGRMVYELKATDPDEKAMLRFEIDRDFSEARNEDGVVVKISEYDFLSAFELNSVNGTLKVGRPIDREKVEIMKIAFNVEDLAAAGKKQISSVIMTVVIDDENDNSPVFRKPFYRKGVTENSQPGITLLSVVADDKDKNRTISYAIEGTTSKTTDLLYLDKDTGELIVTGRIDHEFTSWLNITVRATDSGVPSRSSFIDVFIQIIDENDNNPYFVDSTTSNITVPEDVAIGTTLAIMEARDSDSGDYGKITYLLDRASSQADASQVGNAASVDIEDPGALLFHIGSTVENKGALELSKSAVTANTVLRIVHLSGLFAIDAETGALTVNGELDRESQNIYSLIVEAWDNYNYGYITGESRNAFKQIIITVSDINDNAPTFDRIPDSCVSITEFHEIGDTVILLKAIDADDSNTPNGKVSFYIEHGNEIGLFEIRPVDTLSSRVITTQSLKTLYGNYTLVVRAQDMGTPAKSALTTMNVCVTDFNDNAPRFISPPHNITIRIPENASVNSSVITVEAVDDDKGPNAVVHYALKQDLSGNWKTFSINEKTGLITLRSPLNRKKQKIYQLRVEAYDLGIPTQLSSDLDLNIYVRNINDNQPQFLIDEFVLSFTEGLDAGSEQWQLVDTVDQDRDEVDKMDDPPSPVCYYIVAGNEHNYFTLEPLNHKITTLKKLDREERDVHVLIVKASDDCLNAPSVQELVEFNEHDDTLLRVVIRVNDINDNAPHFLKRVFTGGVTTEADFGTEFMHIKATDADTGIHSELRYFINSIPLMSLSEGLDNIQMPPFVMDEKNGVINLNFDPQREMKGYFEFYVKVNDSGGLEDTAKVLIYLLREDQKVKFVLRQNAPELREKLDKFRDILGNITSAIVNIDECKIHENKDGRVDKTKSDLYLHFVNAYDNTVMEVGDVLRLIDENVERLDDLFKEFNVLDTKAAEVEPLLRTSNIVSESIVWMYCLGLAVFLSLLLSVVTCLCLAQRSRYRRQLKAATLSAFGSSDSEYTRTTNGTGRVPNTNIHSTEGSNPMWMQSYENEWYKGEDSISQASARDSLDENVVSSNKRDEFSANISPFSCDHKNASIQNAVVTHVKSCEQNDLNRNEQRYNPNISTITRDQDGVHVTDNSSISSIPHSKASISNDTVIAATAVRKLETTEL